MKKRLFFSLIALLSVLSAWAYDFEVDGIYYGYRRDNNDKKIDGEVEVTSKGRYYSDYSGSVVIPATVTYDGKTYHVTSIGSSAFRVCTGLMSVEI